MIRISKKIVINLISVLGRTCYAIICYIGILTICLLVKVRLEGLENIPKKGRFILASNHQNFFDGFFVAYLLGPFKRIRFLIAKRALNNKFYRQLFRIIGSVLLGNSQHEYQRAIKKLTRFLMNDEVVCVFPEGDVSSSRVPKKFKGGVAKLSVDSKSLVVPIHLSGTYELRSLKAFLFRRPYVSIKVGKPIDIFSLASRHYNLSLDEAVSFIRENIIQLDIDAKHDKCSNAHTELISHHDVNMIEQVVK